MVYSLLRSEWESTGLGLSGQARHWGSFADLLDVGRHAGVRVGKPDLGGSPGT
jgi:hypothetical protein